MDRVNDYSARVLFWSGGRISETLSLTPGAIDIDGGSIALLTLKRRKRGMVRQVSLLRSVIRELSEFNLPKAQVDPEMTTRRPWPWSRITAWRLVKQVMLEARVVGSQACPKGLRHGAALARACLVAHHQHLP
jgi:integrase/recombinase XerD